MIMRVGWLRGVDWYLTDSGGKRIEYVPSGSTMSRHIYNMSSAEAAEIVDLTLYV